MKELLSGLVAVVLITGMSAVAQNPSATAVSGVVRDVHGTPQMGALVELLGPDAAIIARAFTDDHGRYSLSGFNAGEYQLRASAAFLLPAMRSNLKLRVGAHAVADLTMTAIFEAVSWLPTESRKGSGTSDDWRWTLRSTANRPLLRLDGQPESATVDKGVSSSADHLHALSPDGEISVLAGDGNFGEGGTRQIIAIERREAGGDSSALRADVGAAIVPGQEASMMVSAGAERRSPLGSGTRLFVSFSSHPELQVGTKAGLELWRSATTETVTLGDTVVVDAGTLLTAERLLGTTFQSAPYLRIGFHPNQGFTLEYRLATDRALQISGDLDEMALPEEALADTSGRPLVRKALHQEVSAKMTGEHDAMAVAIYADHLREAVVNGGGALGEGEIMALPVLADPTTDTLRLVAPGYRTAGIRVAWDHAFSPQLSACIEGSMGSAIQVEGEEVHLEELSAALHPQRAGAVSASLQMRTKRSGTSVNAHYRWQTAGTLTQVDEFDVAPQSAYLGVSFRQRLWSGHQLRGLNAVVEATNLLAQGYVPLLGPDGQTLYLTQVSRSVQGGLAFRF